MALVRDKRTEQAARVGFDSLCLVLKSGVGPNPMIGKGEGAIEPAELREARTACSCNGPHVSWQSPPHAQAGT